MLFQTKEITVWVCSAEMPRWEWLAAAELVVILNRTGVLFRVYLGAQTLSIYIQPPESVVMAQQYQYHRGTCYKCYSLDLLYQNLHLTRT